MAIRIFSEIVQSAIDFLVGKRPNASTATGSVIRDVVIESPAQEFSTLYQELAHTQKVQSVKFATDLSTDELDALAFNYGMTRLQGVAAAATVTFQVRNFSFSSSDISIPLATVIATTSTDSVPQVSYQTTQSGEFLAAQAPSYFNPVSGFYEVTVPVVAEQSGSIGNVAAGTITDLISSVPGIDSVTNTIAATGGRDIESNTDFATRIQTKLSGNNVGTPNGIIGLMKENANVGDVAIVGPQDIEMLRNEFGGSVDVYVIGSIVSATSDVRNYMTLGVQEFILTRQPVRAVTSITGLASSSPYTFVENVDYDVVFDTSTLVNGSIELKTKIVFGIGGTNPDNSTNITIFYTYNSLIQELQAVLEASDTHIITSDILVKEAVQATIDVTADVTIFPGFVISEAVSNIQTVLSQNINALGLGDSIDRSDIISIIESVSSVDQVNISTLVLVKNGDTLPSDQQRLQIQKVEYPRINTIVINVVG